MVEWLKPQGSLNACTTLSSHPAGRMLATLIKGAGLHEFATGDLAHPGLESMAHRIQMYAKCIEVMPGYSLDRCLWTNPSALWDGSVAAGLSEFKRLTPGDSPAYVLAYATDANARCLFRSRGSVMRAQHAFYGDFQPCGPYLVLMRCESAFTGKIAIMDGFAISVLGARYPVPVGAALERDILQIVIRLLERIDAFGLEGRLTRKIGPDRLSECIDIAIVWPDGVRRDAKLICNARDKSHDRSDPLCFVATLKTIADGSLLQWLFKLLAV
jgi:hypothetical protein